MKLLKEVNIMGKTFKVEYLDFNKILQCNDMNGNVISHFQRIQVDSSIHKDSQESTLLHEILHVISDSLKLELNENTISQLEAGLYQVFKDNKLFANEVK